MSRKKLFIIPFCLMEIVVQMLYFWIASFYGQNGVIYGLLTVLTVSHFSFIFYLLNHYEGSIVTSAIRTGSFVQIIIIAVAVILMIRNPQQGSVILLAIMLSILYVAIASFHWIKLYYSEESGNHVRNTRMMQVDHRDTVHNEQGERAIVPLRSGNRGTPPPLPVRR